MAAWLHTLQNSAFSAWVVGSDSIWAYPMILTMHTVGLGIVVGAAVIVDLRLLGVGPGVPLDEVKRLFPIFWVGFFINLVSLESNGPYLSGSPWCRPSQSRRPTRRF